MLVLEIVLALSLVSVNCGRKQVEVMDGRGYSVAIKKVECLNSTRVSVYACRQKLIRGKTGEFSLGFIFVEKIPVVLFRLMVESKNSANVYKPTVIDATFNLCEVTSNAMAMGTLERMMTLFAPNAMTIMKPFIHSCPYEGKHEGLNVVVDRLTVPNVISTGDVKLVGIVMDDKKRVLLTVQMYAYIKTPSLMQIN